MPLPLLPPPLLKGFAMTPLLRRTLPLALILMPALAEAHPGHIGADAFAAGLSHPVSGADHVLAMVAVGLWAALAGGRALWAMPLTFMAAMLAGGLAGAAGLPLPGVEPMILASIIALGVAAALALKPSLIAALPAIAVFGIAHGHAHGAEGGGTPAFAAGILIATAALHLAGLASGLGLSRFGSARVARGLGGATALAGLALAFN